MSTIPPETLTGSVKFTGPDWEMRAEVTVPAGPTQLIELLPVVRFLTDSMVGVAAREVEERGEPISCKKGCGACCRQVVPIAEVEARRLRDLVESLPEPRRSTVLARFAEALRRLEAAGLLEPLRHPEQWGDGTTRLGLDYFYQGVPCPFLEEESCSIYEDRPIACREFLVTSPAENCKRPTAEGTRRVPLVVLFSPALARCNVPPTGHRFQGWVPMILALEWAAAHPEPPPARPGPELLGEFLNYARSTVRPIDQAAATAWDQVALSDPAPSEAPS